LELIKYIPVVVAAALLGQWFLKEWKRFRRRGEAWYRPWLSPPGILIGLILLALIGLRVATS